MTMPKEAVKCHLCGKVIEGLFAEPSDGDIEILYYCEECSEKTIEVRCGQCGKIFQEMPVKEEADDEDVEIEYLCEQCSKRKFRLIDINNMEYDPKEIGIQHQRNILSNLNDKSQWQNALHVIGYLASSGNTAAVDYACELLKSPSLDIANRIRLVGSFNVIIDQKIKNALLDILRLIKSDNKTRKLIMLILEKLAETEDKKLVAPLHEIANRFSVKMRSNVENAIKYVYEHEPFSD